MVITDDQMESLARTIFLPIILVMDAWVFQYLVSVYYGKIREIRVCMLLVASFLVFATQFYFHEDLNMLVAMNDISETSLQQTFIIQITIIGRGVSVKVKVRWIVWFTYVAEMFIFLGWLNVFACIFDAAGVISGETFHVLGNVLESVSLVFVLVFRFFYLALSLGFRVLVAERKAEFLVYILLVFHEFPFAILEHSTGISWEFAQAICNRVLMISCILLNVRVKTRGTRSSYTVKSAKEVTPRSVKTSRGRGTLRTKLAPKITSERAFPDIAKVAVTVQFSNAVEVNTNNNT